MDFLSLAFSLFYSVLVVGVCGYLILRGVSHLFVFLFAAGPVLQGFPRIGFFFLQIASGGMGAHQQWFPLLSAVGMLGGLFYLAGFIALAAFCSARSHLR